MPIEFIYFSEACFSFISIEKENLNETTSDFMQDGQNIDKRTLNFTFEVCQMVRSIANRESDSSGAESIPNSFCFFDVATTVCVSWKSRFFLWKMISLVCQFRCIWDCRSSIRTILLFLPPPVCDAGRFFCLSQYDVPNRLCGRYRSKFQVSQRLCVATALFQCQFVQYASVCDTGIDAIMKYFYPFAQFPRNVIDGTKLMKMANPTHLSAYYNFLQIQGKERRLYLCSYAEYRQVQ